MFQLLTKLKTSFSFHNIHPVRLTQINLKKRSIKKIKIKNKKKNENKNKNKNKNKK